jgi:transposase InsO family protein
VSTYRFIQAEEANYSIDRMCVVLRASRSSYYAWRRGETHSPRQEEARLRLHIRAIHRQHRGRYGSPRVTAELREQGFIVNRKRVARLMRDEALQGAPRRAFRGTTTDSSHTEPVAPNILDRDFSVGAPNKVLVGDITYLPTERGWVYLTVLIDLFSRKVVGWAMDETMETSLCLRALGRVCATRGALAGAVHHTDRGAQYASKAYREALKEAGMTQSMSRKGNCWDNAVAESFFGTLEQELRPERPWRNFGEARSAVSHYIHHYYNSQRRHSSIGYKTPIEFESLHHQAAAAAAA